MEFACISNYTPGYVLLGYGGARATSSSHEYRKCVDPETVLAYVMSWFLSCFVTLGNIYNWT